MRWTEFFTFPIKRLVRYLITGLLFWVPLGATFFIVKFLVNLVDRTLVLLPQGYHPENLVGFTIPGVGIVLTFLVLLITGFIFTNLFGRRILDGWERLLNRIPFVRTIYNGFKQVTETVLSDSSRSFKKVALIEYPRRGLWAIGFETSSNLGEVQARTGEDVVCV
ncbi:MAG: DUF502 domain-containing protein, partial [Gammaproteobacteria bacterium]|nr:DUF502 domain-containing protein [Gammaproteobacteria bacterium]